MADHGADGADGAKGAVGCPERCVWCEVPARTLCVSCWGRRGCDTWAVQLVRSHVFSIRCLHFLSLKTEAVVSAYFEYSYPLFGVARTLRSYRILTSSITRTGRTLPVDIFGRDFPRAFRMLVISTKSCCILCLLRVIGRSPFAGRLAAQNKPRAFQTAGF